MFIIYKILFLVKNAKGIFIDKVSIALYTKNSSLK